MDEQNDRLVQLNARIPHNVVQELRQLVIQKHGKLSGSLREEVKRSLEFHVQRLRQEIEKRLMKHHSTVSGGEIVAENTDEYMDR